MNIKFVRLFERISQILLALIILYFSIECVSAAANQTFSFDGGMNVQVAQNLYKTGRYAASYNGLQDFSPIIQTGVTVLLPVAIVFKLFGESFPHGLIVNALYLISLALLIVYYLKKQLKLPGIYVVIAVLFLFATPDIFHLGMGIYGEIPSLTFFLLSIILIHAYQNKQKKILYFFSGVALGLGFLTKTVILIALPAFLFAAAINYFSFAKELRKKHIKNWLLWITGLLTPILLFELYRLIALGNIARYVNWWQVQANKIFAQAGINNTYADTPGIFAKLNTHLNLLSSYLNLHKVGIILLLVVLLAAFILLFITKLPFLHKQKENKGFFSDDLLILFTVTLSYFGWWLIITSTAKAWYRRIIDGAILLEICIPILLFFLYKFLSGLPKINDKKVNLILLQICSGILVAGFLAFSVYNLVDSKTYAIKFAPSSLKVQTIKAGAYIQKLPADAQIFGFGWWQAPLVAFASGRSFDDIQTVKNMQTSGINFKHKYLVIDYYAISIDPEICNEVLSHYKYWLRFKSGDTYIYQLISFIQ